MKRIDPESWERREIFDFFSPLSHPFYAVTFRTDVTALYRFCKARGLSFYYAMIYFVTRAVNETEAFLYTIRGDGIYLLDRREPSFTDRFASERFFHIVTMPCGGSVEEFCAAAAKKSHAQTGFIDHAAEGDALVYLSSLPWLDMTALTNERDLDRDDAIPRIAWGKYTETEGRKTLALSVEVNHRFVDGADIGAFARRLEELIGKL